MLRHLGGSFPAAVFPIKAAKKSPVKIHRALFMGTAQLTYSNEVAIKR
jgi:hypothetical protein